MKKLNASTAFFLKRGEKLTILVSAWQWILKNCRDASCHGLSAATWNSPAAAAVWLSPLSATGKEQIRKNVDSGPQTCNEGENRIFIKVE